MGLRRAAVISLGVLVVSLAFGASDPAADDDPRAPVLEAMRHAGPIPAQARALANLAWPADVDTVDPRVREEARQELVRFGVHGAGALRDVVRTRPEVSAEALASLVEIRTNLAVGLPPAYGETLDEALWFGSREARRIAMEEYAVLRRALNFLAVVDAAEEDGELVPLAIDTLAAIREPRARFWLSGFLGGDDPALRDRAAHALGAIGGAALEPLKDALASEDGELRATAARAIVPVAGSTELTALYEYLDAFPDDPPDLVGAVRERALAIERAIDAWHLQDEATPDGSTR